MAVVSDQHQVTARPPAKTAISAPTEKILWVEQFEKQPEMAPHSPGNYS